jgi:hypothetical protein
MRKLLVLLVLCALSAYSQVKSEAQQAPGTAGPEPRLVEENASYRVLRIEFDNDLQIPLPQHGNDVIVVVLGDGVSVSSATPVGAEKLVDGEVRLVERSAHATLIHSGANFAQVLLVGLKQHWDAEIRPCTFPQTCVRPIRAGGQEIGQSESLFTNGFVTAYRHRMDRGGTLSSSYYSKRATHHLMVVALDDLRANFEGTEQDLKRGQVFGSDAGEVEVEAGAHPARWVVIRVESQKG